MSKVAETQTPGAADTKRWKSTIAMLYDVQAKHPEHSHLGNRR